MLIYKAENKTNGKCYVGQTINSLGYRKRHHINDALNKRNGVYFHRAIRKYGVESFEWVIIHDDITTTNLLNQLEIFYIGYYDTYNNGYNLTLGGRGGLGFTLSEDHKRKISKAMKGKKLSEKSKRKMSKANKGKNHSQAKAVMINNKYFDTIKEAAGFIGISRSSVRRRILHQTKWKNYSCV